MLDGRVPGSFRDPSGFVFLHGGRVLRAVDEGCFQSLEKLHSDGTLARLSQTHGLVATQIVEQEADVAALESVYSDTYRYLEHERITPITYPYEWTLSMLADAAICTLDLQLELANSGYSLKDATPFNVQFVAGKPKFIDVASIELPGRRDIWFALGQFFQLFLYPLLLCRYRGGGACIRVDGTSAADPLDGSERPAVVSVAVPRKQFQATKLVDKTGR